MQQASCYVHKQLCVFLNATPATIIRLLLYTENAKKRKIRFSVVRKVKFFALSTQLQMQMTVFSLALFVKGINGLLCFLMPNLRQMQIPASTINTRRYVWKRGVIFVLKELLPMHLIV